MSWGVAFKSTLSFSMSQLVIWNPGAKKSTQGPACNKQPVNWSSNPRPQRQLTEVRPSCRTVVVFQSISVIADICRPNCVDKGTIGGRGILRINIFVASRDLINIPSKIVFIERIDRHLPWHECRLNWPFGAMRISREFYCEFTLTLINAKVIISELLVWPP